MNDLSTVKPLYPDLLLVEEQDGQEASLLYVLS